MYQIKNYFGSSNLKTILIVWAVLFTNSIFAQLKLDAKINQNGAGGNATFFQIQNSMNKYWDSLGVKNGFVLENGVERKIPNWKLYKRWEYYWEQRVNQTTGEFPQTNSIDEYVKYKNSHPTLNKENTFNESWVNLGTNSSDGGYAGIGRINCIAFHPTDANTFWVGSPSGGIWKTINGGTSWTNLNDNQSVLGVSAIVIPSDYATSNTIYIATGDRDGGSMSGLSGGQAADNASIGVLKSTDGGSTWAATGLSYTASQKKLIYSLVIHPTNNSILLASTSDGIYKTTNGGVSWSQKYTEKVWRLAFKPGSSSIIYGGSEIPYSDVWFMKSIDAGETWPIDYKVTSSSHKRAEICVAPSDPSIVYLLVSNSSGGVLGVYKSTDSGVSFSVVNPGSPAGMLGYYTDGRAPASGQGHYDWCIAVDPLNADIVYIGGITTWKSTDGGVTWTAINNWTSSSGPPPYDYNTSGVPVVHADKHTLAYQNSTTLFEGNDGGIYKTADGGTSWTDLTNGMVISQIYRLGVSQTISTKTITGLQDNGSKLFNSGTWSDVTGGDGMECIIDFSDANYMYATYVQGQIKRSTNGSTFAVGYITANIPGGQPTGAWVTPYVIDPNNNLTLFAAYDSVWKTTDRGNTWSGVSQELSNTNKIRSLAIAPSNSNVLYAADQTNMWKTTDGGATNWSTVTLPALSGNSITYIAVKNTDPSTLWITSGGFTAGSKIFESTDGGSTWTNISTGLPNLPVMCITYYKDLTDRNVLFVGTDVGVYVKDGAADWASYSTGLPNVVVSELEIFYDGANDRLRAATFGRGLWETVINSPLPVELSSFTADVEKNKVTLKWITQTEVNNYGFEIERKILNQVQNDTWNKIGFENGYGNSNSPKEYSFVDAELLSGNYEYRLKQIDNDGQTDYSDILKVTIGVPLTFELAQNYPNPFNPSTTIRFSLPEASIVKIKVFNALGEEAANLANELYESGSHEIIFNAEDLTSGIYFVRMEAGAFTSTKKITLMK